MPRRIHNPGGNRSASRPRAGRAAELGRALETVASRQHGVIAAQQLLALGFTRRRIQRLGERRVLIQVHRGVYAAGHVALSRHGRWLAATLAAGEGSVLSHRDATSIWGLGEYTRPEIEVLIPELGSRRRPGLRIHRTRRLDASEIGRVEGIPVTSVSRTLVDLAGSVGARHLRASYLEAERLGLLDLKDLVEVLEFSRGRRGVKHLRKLVASDNSALFRTRSELEVRFLDLCKRERLPTPLVNARVAGYEVDAYWPEANLVVELDGYEFHRGRGAFERDRAKIGDLILAGLEVLPATHLRLVNQPGEIAAAIRRVLASAARGGSSTARVADPPR